MSTTVKRVVWLASTCFLLAYLSELLNEHLDPYRLTSPLHFWTWIGSYPNWTVWDFVTLIMFVASAGCAIAALRIHANDLHEAE